MSPNSHSNSCCLTRSSLPSAPTPALASLKTSASTVAPHSHSARSRTAASSARTTAGSTTRRAPASRFPRSPTSQFLRRRARSRTTWPSVTDLSGLPSKIRFKRSPMFQRISIRTRPSQPKCSASSNGTPRPAGRLRTRWTFHTFPSCTPSYSAIPTRLSRTPTNCMPRTGDSGSVSPTSSGAASMARRTRGLPTSTRTSIRSRCTST